MPKQLIKRLLPTPGKLREFKSLGILGEWIYEPNLWHINRNSASVAFFVGLFVAFVPMPSQMVLACLLSVWLRCNLPLAVALCWITNPLTMGPIFWFAYKLGALVMGEPTMVEQFSISWEWLTTGLVAIWQPFLLGCLLCGFFFGSLGYFVVQTLWRWQVVQRWETRQENRQLKLELATRDVALRQAAILQPDGPDTVTPENTAPTPPN
jgi:uncharacterized protein (DUF2062 family)